ncbi:MAG: HAD family hydrolase [Rhizobiaceae bacterium]
MDIRAIIFDKDGTLIDFPATFNPATDRVLAQLCGEDRELLRAAADVWDFDLVTKTVDPKSVIVSASSFEIAEALSTVIPVHDIGEFGVKLDEMFGAVCVETVTPLPDTEATLHTLKANRLMLGIGTNDAEANAVAQMQTLGFLTLFDKIFGADSGHGPKPGPGMIEAFTEMCGLEPQQVLMVGDSLHDLESGKSAGVRTCGVETGPADRITLEKHADMVLQSIADLPGHVGLLM